jgi:cell division protein FtsI (penicillin-binding protein 3)
VTRPPLRRLIAMFLAMLVLLVGIVARLGMLQVRDRHQYEMMGISQRERTIVLPAQRGEILDRHGTPLAITLPARDIYADPELVTDPQHEALRIAPILGLKVGDVRQALSASGTFAYIARQVDTDVAQRVADLALPGIDQLPVAKRYYPSGALAPQALGFVGVDGGGLAGLESQYDLALRGTSGRSTQEFSPGGLPISSGTDRVTAPVPGRNLVTTIDRQMQYAVQQALQDDVVANHAKGGTVVVMDPATGDIYAMATYPSFDPSHIVAGQEELWRDRAVTDTLEPGSVSKIITAAAALQTGAVNIEQRFRVPASMQVGPFLIQDSEVHPIESMTLGDIITHSSNIGSTIVASRVGSTTLATYMDRFGYGKLTGVGLPGEATGTVPTAWDDVIRASASFGQGVSVTPLQMADVYATIANGGQWIQPRLVRGMQAPGGAFDPAPASPTRTVISAATAHTLTRMLAEVVHNGTGVEAQIPGYQVAGKTGTSRTIDAATGRYVDRYEASFVGFLPAGRPRVVVAVTINQPRTVYGGVAAAPLFSQIARYAIQRLGIPAAPKVPLPPTAMPMP